MRHQQALSAIEPEEVGVPVAVGRLHASRNRRARDELQQLRCAADHGHLRTPSITQGGRVSANMTMVIEQLGQPAAAFDVIGPRKKDWTCDLCHEPTWNLMMADDE